MYMFIDRYGLVARCFVRLLVLMMVIVLVNGVQLASAARLPLINGSFDLIEADVEPEPPTPVCPPIAPYNDYQMMPGDENPQTFWRNPTGWTSEDSGITSLSNGVMVFNNNGYYAPPPQRMPGGIEDGTQVMGMYLNAGPLGRIVQDLDSSVTFQPSTTYTITGWAGLIKDPISYANSAVSFSLYSSHDEYYDPVLEVFFPAGSFTAGSFQYGSASFTTPAADGVVGANMAISLEVHRESGTAYPMFDGIRIYEGAVPDAVTWTGAGSSAWNAATGLNNWKLTSGGTAADYVQEADVVFDDSATATTVDISTIDVDPSSIKFNNSTKNYVVQGSNRIDGGDFLTTLHKTGTGDVTINNTNSFKGNVTIDRGSITVGTVADKYTNSPLGAGAVICFTGGTLKYTGTGAASTDREIFLQIKGGSVGTGGGTIEVSESTGTLTLNGQINGGSSLTKTGPGTLVCTVAGYWEGGTVLEEGTLQVASAGAGHFSPMPDSNGNFQATDVQAGKLVIDYSVAGEMDVTSLYNELAAGFAVEFASGDNIFSSTADSTHGLALTHDVAAQQAAVTYALYGDANLDGQVNDVDATIMAANWGATGDVLWSRGDFNYDGTIDAADAAMISSNWLKTLSASVAAANAVPEPGTLVLLGLGALSLLLMRRKKYA